MNVALCANLLLLPLLLVERNGLSPFLIGFLLFIASLFGILSSMLTGKVIPTFRNIKMINVSTIIMILGFLVLSFISNANVFAIQTVEILTFMSYSAIQVSLNTLIPKTLNASKIGVGLGLYNLLNFVGMAFDPAVASKLMELTNSYSLDFLLISILLAVHFLLLFKLFAIQSKVINTQ